MAKQSMSDYMKQFTGSLDADVDMESSNETNSSNDNADSNKSTTQADDVSDVSLVQTVREFQVLMTAVQDVLTRLSETLADSEEVVPDPSSPPDGEPSPEQGESTFVASNSEPTNNSSGGSEEASQGTDESYEIGAPVDPELKGRHGKFVGKFGLHIPEKDQTVDDFKSEQLKEVPYEKWVSESLPFLLASNAFTADRVKGWPGV